MNVLCGIAEDGLYEYETTNYLRKQHKVENIGRILTKLPTSKQEWQLLLNGLVLEYAMDCDIHDWYMGENKMESLKKESQGVYVVRKEEWSRNEVHANINNIVGLKRCLH